MAEQHDHTGTLTRSQKSFPECQNRTWNHTRNKRMKNFKTFLENYDFYLDKPLGFKKPEEADQEEADGWSIGARGLPARARDRG